MKRSNRMLVGAGAALLIGVTVAALMPRALEVDMQPVRTGRFESTIDEEGRTRVRQRHQINAPAAGQLARIAVAAGDRVEAGALLAVIHPAPPALQDARALAQLRERVGAAEAGVMRADANRARARAALMQAEASADRERRLAAQGFASKSVEEQSRLTLDQQRQALRAAEFDCDAAGHELALARAALAQSGPRGRPDPTARLEIRTPAAGRVLRVLRESEGSVAVGAALLEIGDPDLLEATIDVPSQAAIGIRPGMPVRMRAAPDQQEVPGHVRTIEPSATTRVSALGIEEQRVRVIADFDAPPNGVGDAYRIDASIVVMTRDDATVVPVGALFRHGDGWAVFVDDDRRARLRPVSVGARNQQLAWITDGLVAGARVLVYPPDTVRDGTRIRQRAG